MRWLISLFASVIGGGSDRAAARGSAPAGSHFEYCDVVTLTPLAAEKIREACRGMDGRKPVYLRVGIKLDGPIAFRYLLEITEDADIEMDLLGTSQGIQIVVDRKSSLYLRGTKLDYRIAGKESGFHFDNPNAQKEPPPAAVWYERSPREQA